MTRLLQLRALQRVTLFSLFTLQVFGQVNVLTNRYNLSRTAANVNESQLNVANVNSTNFGTLGKYFVDGVIYSQPLYVQGVTVNGATHNVLYVATMHDVLYAFDADNVGSLPLWTIDFRNLAAGISPPVIHPANQGDGSDTSVADTFGIFGTPVIDLPNNLIFLVTHTNENGTECFRLRSVDIRSGQLLGSTLITGSVAATAGAGGATFIANKYGQRAALEVVNGKVWVGFGSRPSGDYTNPYQGWIMTYNETTLAQTGVFATSQTNGNGVWQSGAGPAVDANSNVYYLTGNGNLYDGATDFPMTLLQLNSGSNLTLNNWFTPNNSSGLDDYITMDNWDLDLSVNGPMLIPGTDLVAFGSKTADVYTLHTGNLGQLTPGDTQVAQLFHVGAPVDYTQTASDRIVGMAFWQNSNGGTLYVWPGLDTLHTYTLNPGSSTFTQSFAGTLALSGQPSTALALSANGSDPNTGILWAPVANTTQDLDSVGEPGILHSYNASNPSQELWNSNMNASDYMGSVAKFVPPVVVNGKVYVANSAVVGAYGDGSVTVFGLKSSASTHVAPSAALVSPANSSVFAVGSIVTLTASVAASPGNTLANVEFMDGTTVLATIATAPYTFNWTAAGIGSHTLTAIAIDQTGAPTVSFPATISVVATPLRLTASPAVLQMRPGGVASAQIVVTNPTGYSGSYVLSASTLPSGLTSTWNASILSVTASTTAALATTTITVTAVSNGNVVGSIIIPITVAQSGALVKGVNSVTFTVPSGVTLGTPVVFTEGVPSSTLASPDFSLLSSGTTCTGSATGTCNAQIQFTPQFAGLRRGAVELVDVNNNVLSTQYFYGNGTMSQPAWSAAAPKTIYKNGSSHGVAVDGGGNVFVIDSWVNRIFKIAPGGTPVALQLGVALKSPFGLALDAAGNLYIADAANNQIVELPYGAASATILNISGLNVPEGMAVDGSGNLFIANTEGSSYGSHGDIIQVAPGTGVQTIIASAGLGFPSGVAVDAVGDVFIADWYNNRVLELAVGGAQISIGRNLALASSVAVDGLGNVFITDQNHNQLVEVPATASGPGTGIQVTVATGLVAPYGLALDGQGDVFIENAGNATAAGGVVEIPNTALQPTQAITFGSIPAQTAGTFLTLSASVNSGLPITYTATASNACSVAGNTVTVLAAGTCTITASQPGNNTYPAAVSVTQSFGVTGPAQTIVVPFKVPGGTTLASPIVFTEGVPSSSLPSPDFTLSSNTCTGATSGICTASIQFTPRFAGLRRGALQMLSSNNTVLTTTYFFGTGTLAQSAWTAGASKTLYKQGTRGVAVDAAGDVFLLDSYSSQVFKIAPGGTATAVPLGLTLNSAYGLALDAAGNLYIADAGNNRVVQLPYGGSTATVLNISGLNYPEGLAIDGSGNLFIANTRQTTTNSGTGNVIEFALSSGAQATVINSGLNVPSGVAVDAAGDLFIADKNNNRVLEIPASGATPVSIGTGLSGASTVAVDSLGDVFITDQNHNLLVEVPGTASGPGTGTQVTLATGLAAPYGLALDSVGDVFIVNAGNATTTGSLMELQNLIPLPKQSITFGVIASQTAGTFLPLTATASSGLPVSYTSSTLSVCTVSGSTATLLSAGTCTITASQAGNSSYPAATPVIQSFSVSNTAQTIVVPFNVPSGTTLATPIVFTEGVPSSLLPSPDFTLSSNTCAGATSGTCTASIQFTPRFAGLRRGALQIISSNNTVLSTSYFSGTGTLAQSAWTAGAAKTLYRQGTRGVAVDAAGDVFLLDSYLNQVFKIAPGGTPIAVPLGLTLNTAYGLALDAAGNLYIADAGNNRVVELPYGSSTASVLNISSLNYPEGLAVDGSGTLFIANTRQTATTSGTGNVIEFALSSGAQTTVLNSGLNLPSGVAVDAAGDLFIADKSNNRVLKIPASAGTPVSIGTGLSGASTVAVDALGDVFITDQNHSLLVEVPGTTSGPGTGTQVTVATGLAAPYGLALDSAGDVFIVNAGNATTTGSLIELQNVVPLPKQSITFGVIASQIAGTFLSLTATASSGLPVSYTSSTLGVCTVSGSTATLLSAGTCTITASQAGNSSYPAATSVIQSFIVSGPAQTIVVPFNVPSGTTLAAPVVFTEGVPGSLLPSPDFTLSSNTCTGATSGTCTASIQLTPRFAGLRRGALQIVSSNNTVLATTYFFGTGTVAQSPWTAGASKILYRQGTRGVAVDAAGDVFLLDSYLNQVFKIVPGGTATAVPLGLTLNSAYGLALDAAGNLYIADAGNNRVVELPYGASSASVLNISGLNYPEGLAVDGSGNLFIANTRQTATASGTGNVIEFALSSGAQTTVVNSGLNLPSGVAVDAAGDLFIADKSNNRVLEIPASGATPVSIGTGLSGASTVAVDSLGDVFITDQNHNLLVEVPGTASGPGTGTQVTVATGLATPYGLALDSAADVFLVNAGNATASGSLMELQNVVPLPKQSITFGVIASQTAGTFLTLTATASSGLPVSYISSTVGVCTVSGSTATLLSAGTCTITASQAATSVVQSFSVTGPAQTVVVPFNVPSGTTLATPIVFTEGVPSASLTSPDFTLSSNTCTGASSGTCTASIQFTPRFAGLRRGALQMLSSNNTVLSTTYFFGTGTVAQSAWTAGPSKTLYSQGTRGVAVDAAGDVFLLDSYLNQVFKIVPGGTATAVPLGLTLNSAYGLALDAAGNLYIADAGNNRVVELPYGSSSASVLNISGLNYPEGLAVDGSGNLFIANTRQTAAASGTGNVIEFALSSGVQTTVLNSGLNLPSGVAVDAAGDLFIADKSNNRVLEIPASGATPVSIGIGLSGASTVAVDSLGDVFITDQNHSLLVEVPGTASGPGTGTQVTVATGLVAPYGLALDSAGDVFIVNAGDATTTGSLIELIN